MKTSNVEIKIIDKNIAATKYKISKIANKMSNDPFLNDVIFASITPAQFSKIKKLNVKISIQNGAVQMKADMKSIIIDLRNHPVNRQALKNYIFKNANSAYETKFLPNVIYAYIEQEFIDYLINQNIKIKTQNDFKITKML